MGEWNRRATSDAEKHTGDECVPVANRDGVVAYITVQVADLDDVIQSKSAAARPKDLDALPELIDIAEARQKSKTPLTVENRGGSESPF